jgi:hypothetical protein
MVIVMNIFRQQKRQPHCECNVLSPFPFQQFRSLARLRAKYGEFRSNLLIAFAAYGKKNPEIFDRLSSLFVFFAHLLLASPDRRHCICRSGFEKLSGERLRFARRLLNCGHDY